MAFIGRKKASREIRNNFFTLSLFLFWKNDTEFHKSHSKWAIVGVFHRSTRTEKKNEERTLVQSRPRTDELPMNQFTYTEKNSNGAQSTFHRNELPDQFN